MQANGLCAGACSYHASNAVSILQGRPHGEHQVPGAGGKKVLAGGLWLVVWAVRQGWQAT